MSDTGKFWLGANAIFAIGLCIIVSLSLDYWKDHNSKIVSLIKEGVDPAAAMCAMQNDYGDHPSCVVLAAKSK